jgi:hypothetical protein
MNSGHLLLKNYSWLGTNMTETVITYNLGTYKGEVKHDIPHGRGSFEGNDGHVYIGNFENGKKHGHGILTCKSKYKVSKLSIDYTYVGEWKDGSMDGKGKCTYIDGNEYNGEWKMGQRNGKGVLRLVNGDEYDGDWLDDKRHGKGLYSYANRYEGEWAYANGTEAEIPAQDLERIATKKTLKKKLEDLRIKVTQPQKKLEHMLNKIQKLQIQIADLDYHLQKSEQGKLLYIYVEGSKHLPRDPNKVRHDKGVYIQGDKYWGMWFNDEKHGSGTFKRGDMYDGMWVKDKKNGKAVVIIGEQFSGQYQHNWRISGELVPDATQIFENCVEKGE